MIQAQRVGTEAFVTLTVPARNIDGSMPVDIGRHRGVRLHGTPAAVHRAMGSARSADLPLASTIRSFLRHHLTLRPKTRHSHRICRKAALTGTMVTVIDALTPQKLVQGKTPEEPRRGRGAPLTPIVNTNEPDVLRRFYHGDRIQPSADVRRPPGTAAEFPLVEAPSRRRSSTRTTRTRRWTFEWPPSGGIVGFLFRQPASAGRRAAQRAVRADSWTTPPAAANATRRVARRTGQVQRVSRGRSRSVRVSRHNRTVSWAGTAPMPINPIPLATTSFMDSVEFDRERLLYGEAGCAERRPTPSKVIRRRPTVSFRLICFRRRRPRVWLRWRMKAASA